MRQTCRYIFLCVCVCVFRLGGVTSWCYNCLGSWICSSWRKVMIDCKIRPSNSRSSNSYVVGLRKKEERLGESSVLFSTNIWKKSKSKSLCVMWIVSILVSMSHGQTRDDHEYLQQRGFTKTQNNCVWD